MKIKGSLYTLILLVLSSTIAFAQKEKKEMGNLVIEDVPEVPQVLKDRMTQYQNTRSATLADWYPDGSAMLIRTRFGETTQLFKVEKPGGSRQQLTFFPEPVSGGAFTPDSEMPGFTFNKDIGGNEYYQIFWYDLKSGRTKMLTDGESRNTGALWSNKGDKYVYSSTKRTGVHYDVYVGDPRDPGNAKMVLEGQGYWVATDWSPDDSKLLVFNYISITKSFIHILDLETGKTEQVNPSDQDISYGGAFWSADGNSLYLISDEKGEFRTLQHYDIAKNKLKSITSDIPWNISGGDINKDRTKAVFTANENGLTKLYVFDTKTMEYKKVPDLPPGQVYGTDFHPDGKTIGMVLNSTQSPGDIYSLDTESMKLERWTYSEVGGLNTSTFAKPELIEYETFDKKKIPAFIYRPSKADGPLPVVINIHGGPEGQHRPFFSSTTAFLTNELGIAVIAPNVRGSAGYGKSYLKLDNGFNRHLTVQDIGALIDWIEKNPDFDASRIAVYGGSYGGYMVLGSMFNYNDRIRCGVDIVGISNFVTFLENTKEYRRDLRRVEYGDERDPKMREYLMSISPTTNAEKITKPLFVIQGANDPRVPASESEQMVAKIRENGGDVWYLLAKDEGHGFRKKGNRDYMTNAIMMFFEKYLLGEQPGEQQLESK